MTLGQLRAELTGGTIAKSAAPGIDVRAASDELTRRLHQVASKRAAGVRLQLPCHHMPVLP
ncbi:hypothetical protein [Paraburkholderia sp. D1E]|uniref:hypothetical protein n=1 Tax=Paraburkholderia sp. D1E TaxID=3461398 RepID=UPI0040461A49